MILSIHNPLHKGYLPLNKISISKINLLGNYKHLSNKSKNIKILPVLKSNAYGHGIVEIAKILDEQNPAMFCVDSLYEAYELKKAKIKTPILIMGYINPQNLKVKKLPFSYAAYDLNLLETINKYQKGAQVHIKVDTGMHRLGVPIDELDFFLREAKKFENIKIVGLMSHFASADNPSDSQNNEQIENFKKAKQIFKDQGIELKWFHLANSDGLLNLQNDVENVTNAARVGLALYGIHQDEKDLKPVLELTSQIVQIKNLKKGEKVGYSGTFQADRNVKIGLLPIGYNDGVDRRLSNLGYAKLNGAYCKFAGRVSMNIAAIDISKVANPKIGDEVVIYSRIREDLNSIQNAAQLCKTIPYELLIHLSPISIKREIV